MNVRHYVFSYPSGFSIAVIFVPKHRDSIPELPRADYRADVLPRPHSRPPLVSHVARLAHLFLLRVVPTKRSPVHHIPLN